jgi:hypothetical protein
VLLALRGLLVFRALLVLSVLPVQKDHRALQAPRAIQVIQATLM